MGVCFSKGHKYDGAIDESFIGALIPDSEWHHFCSLWSVEEGKTLSCKDKVCFVVATGEVWATVATAGRENWNRVRRYEAGEVIHLFSNTDLASDDGGQLMFGDLKMTFTVGKSTTVAGLPMSKFKKFIDEKPRLSALGTILKLRMSTVVANNSFFDDIPPSKLNALGPLLNLRVVHEGDILSEIGTSKTEMAIIISATCLALHHDNDLPRVKKLIDEQVKGEKQHKRHGQSVMSITTRKSEHRKHTSVMEAISGSMRHIGSARVHNATILKLDDEGEVLRSGSIYGVELAVLPKRHSFKNLLATRKGVVGVIDPAMLKTLRLVDEAVPRGLAGNYSHSIMQTMKEFIPLFTELQDADCKMLAHHVTYELKDKGEILFTRGQHGSKFYVVLGGVTEEVEDGMAADDEPEEYLVGDYFGEVPLVTGTPYTSTMTVKVPAVLLVFTDKTFQSIFLDNKVKAAEMKIRIAGADLELLNVLEYPPSRVLFEKYLIKEMAPENLNFWAAVERVEDMCARLGKQGVRVKAGVSARIAGGKSVRITVTAASAGVRDDAPLFMAEGASSGALKQQDSKKTEASSGDSLNKYAAAGAAPVDTHHQQQQQPQHAHSGTPTVGSSAKTPSSTSSKVFEGIAGGKAYGAGMKQIREVAKSLMETYIHEGSPNQVNLPGKMRVQLETDFNAWCNTFLVLEDVDVPKDLFTKAKIEAYNLMRKDTFPRWKQTDEFRLFFESIKPLPARKGSADLSKEAGAKGAKEGSTGSSSTAAAAADELAQKLSRKDALRASWSSQALARQNSISVRAGAAAAAYAARHSLTPVGEGGEGVKGGSGKIREEEDPASVAGGVAVVAAAAPVQVATTSRGGEVRGEITGNGGAASGSATAPAPPAVQAQRPV